MITRTGLLGMLPALLLAVTGCRSEPAARGPGNAERATEVTVFAASSLTDAFAELAEDYRRTEPGVSRVTFNFAGSQQLAGQILQGAPADVLASASPASMDLVTEAGAASAQPATFAGNALTIAVESGNPQSIGELADLADPRLKVVLAAAQVPAGQYAAEALAGAGVTVHPVSLENDVRAVVSKVALGEADAGVVYATDVAAAEPDVEGVMIPEGANVIASYPIVTLADAPNPSGAAAFVNFVRSRRGQRILVGHGFRRP